ncbi:hypothetical protein CFC21_060650 [Triticum aestivum]|uniref:Cystatin domain-containing protein n=4 Tax=Triticinae TaxID=1648030 RepID=A0A453HBC4_AEGTS|nr:cysteine proteinase inhibitor 8 [Aegilops tauschii subsp. strangulata]XP_044377618.1 cysteine proteinase inhibitor 8-like [Triticum aestivum]KAF7052566.1 hypothetical protein CFC21_060650 [Triticum aestivum]
MARRPLVLLALLAMTLAVASAVLGDHSERLGEWGPIPNLKDAHIQELGGWAVQHASLASNGLRFRRVTRGEQQVVSGMNYRLFVDAEDDSGKNASYLAEVYEQSWTKTRQLKSFKPAAN